MGSLGDLETNSLCQVFLLPGLLQIHLGSCGLNAGQVSCYTQHVAVNSHVDEGQGMGKRRRHFLLFALGLVFPSGFARLGTSH